MTGRPDKGTGGFARLARAFRSTWQGFQTAWRIEEAFRLECLLALVLVPVGLWLGSNGVERALLVAPVLLLLAIELINSAVEATVDRIGVERHPLSGFAKDCGSAAVFVAFALIGVSWVLVLT